MDFTFADEDVELLHVVQRAARVLAPGYTARDRGESSVDEVFRVLADASLIGLSAPPEAHGQGASALANGMACEALAAADWTAAALAAGTPTWLKLIYLHGDKRLHGWLPPLAAGQRRLAFSITEQQSGSDTSNIRTVARRQGSQWVIKGEKNSTSWPSADAAILLAKIPDEGSALFLVPLNLPGISISRLADLGNHPTGRSIITYDDVVLDEQYRLGEPGVGLRSIMSMFTIQKVLLSLMCIGAANAVVQEAIEWAKQRVTFGKPLSTRQGITYPLVEGLADLEMGRLLCYKALWLHDHGLPFRREASMVKSIVPRRAVLLCHDAMLVLGHSAYSTEHPAQLRLRDIMSAEFAEGPEHIQKNLLSREIFGMLPG